MREDDNGHGGNGDGGEGRDMVDEWENGERESVGLMSKKR